ncbi:hypothetical protein QQ73_05160 [Candidatus Endoriftia persephone str. Guaymas]|jgi:hypothetical protein|uniref:Antitoxin Xre/MbcA/ParS-like toxin-binding domain-containing protein n=2 Tax=Gammaproteobacteria TaxID=1236 RepID=G2FFS4_9GAMM|nr:DUF2384 domain-containing protein [Candidatus Endoriftia persephone]EGW54326.1 hypothetical protein TevJSym_an00330 [endosymbiont of Tevnia jerichonana (vent Tica)]MBA1330574.1 hypothetical protein [Candidatus Endoriftia persephone str. Guaymas]USF87027.1 DUF2384 domain-containing protein [Candidatus Endoriftia persephone]
MTENKTAEFEMSLNDRLDMTQSVLNMLESWGLRAEEMMALLSVEGKPRHFMRYRQDTPFPHTPELMTRIEYLVRIDDALRTTYPGNPQIGRRWFRQANHKLSRRTPLSVMLDGEKGMVSVLCHLDCTFAWDMSGSRNTSCRTL